MDIKNEILFKSTTFLGLNELIKFWNKDKPRIIHAKKDNVRSRIQKWKKKNPNKKLTDKVYEKFLTTRNATSVILYKNKYYKPKILFKKLKKEHDVIILYQGFHAKMQYWKKQNKSLTPSDTDIEKFALSYYIKDKTGKYIGSKRNYYNSIPKPKLSWSTVAKKLSAFIKKNNIEPSKDQIKKMIHPKLEWMKREKNEKYLDKYKRQITQREFYDLFDIDKVKFGTWSTRVSKHNKRSGKNITSKKAIVLLNDWGSVDRVIGIIYKITNNVNNKVYIGITTQSLKERLRIHKRSSKTKKLNPLGLHFHINKLGLNNFKIEKIKTVKNLLQLALVERKLIKKYKSLAPKGYNLDKGGKGVSLRKLPITFKGKKYKNLESIGEDYNVPNLLEGRLRLGWTLEEATSLPKGILKNSRYTKITGNLSIPILAKKYGVNKSNVYHRMNRGGWSLDEALEVKKRQMVSGGAKIYNVEGKVFLSGERLAKYYKITFGALRYRLGKGWTVEEAVGLKKR
ncbi:GIY-YIG nuclease family protein [Candidatus Pelagibacter sp.]|jgi:predicted GIY-YIG superfamily endonuclease|nr:GIY-YIG nuclease family protein [Candidatus Pelagibacter sp.]|tara:strand:- start:32 stop:1564 length:1533 start_codon:yes stop_codon:yes gene_type:complete